MRICAICGAQIEDGMKFCGGCGAVVADAADAAQAAVGGMDPQAGAYQNNGANYGQTQQCRRSLTR